MSESQEPKDRLQLAAEAYDAAAAELEAWKGDQTSKAFLDVWNRFRAALSELTQAARTTTPAAEQTEDA